MPWEYIGTFLLALAGGGVGSVVVGIYGAKEQRKTDVGQQALLKQQIDLERANAERTHALEKERLALEQLKERSREEDARRVRLADFSQRTFDALDRASELAGGLAALHVQGCVLAHRLPFPASFRSDSAAELMRLQGEVISHLDQLALVGQREVFHLLGNFSRALASRIREDDPVLCAEGDSELFDLTHETYMKIGEGLRNVAGAGQTLPGHEVDGKANGQND